MKFPIASLATIRRRWPVAAPTVVATLLMIAPLAAQSPPPPTGTIALEGTMKKVYRATNVIVVATLDGVERVYHFAKDLVVHGGKKDEALVDLREGTTVVVHFLPNASEPIAQEIDRIDVEGLDPTEGVVTRIDRGRRQITLRYDNGRTETFQLTERAAAENAASDAALMQGRVVIYYSNEARDKVVHYFRSIDKR